MLVKFVSIQLLFCTIVVGTSFKSSSPFDAVLLREDRLVQICVRCRSLGAFAMKLQSF